MNHKFIADFRNYDLTLTTSMNSNHGVSGHLFELIEYFYYFRFWHNIKTNILIPFELTKEQFKDALKKYNFHHNEILEYINNTFFIKTPQIFFGNIVIFTDGNMYHPKYYNGIIKCNKKIFLRCNNNETLDKADIILQDFRLYDNTKNAIHYVKKLLFDKMIRIKASYTNTALLYATSNCRMVSYDEMEILKSKYNFSKYIVLSDKDFKVPDKFDGYSKAFKGKGKDDCCCASRSAACAWLLRRNNGSKRGKARGARYARRNIFEQDIGRCV